MTGRAHLGKRVRPSRRIASFVKVLSCLTVAAIACPAITADAQVAPFAPTHMRLLHGDEPSPIASVSVSPSALVMPPGAVLRFASVVTGAADLVTWTATGGTVTPDGTFTAGPTAGLFQVRATSSGGAVSDYAQVAIVPLAPGTGYVSDRAWTSMVNGWGPVEKDRSNGDAAVGDGLPLTLNGVTYMKGLGAHGLSDIRFALNGGCSAFTATIGVDGETAGAGSVGFQLWGDGVKLYDSGVKTGTMAGTMINISLVGARELGLVVTDGGDGNSFDHADWADAKITCPADVTAPTVTSVTPAPGSVIPTNARITITFSEPMNPDTLNGKTILLVPQPPK
jgi:hypothetical protein